MKTFLELASEISGLSEFRVVNRAARRKAALRMKRLTKSSAFKQKVARSKLRIASPEKQQVKAAKRAKRIVLDKYFKNYDKMPVAQKVKIDQMIQQKYGGLIAKLTLKQKKFVKKAEVQKVKDARTAKKDA
tara:strand:+ start:102 stop:494 length:393 start_codon:yes stop_codon:yes gene_type:complete